MTLKGITWDHERGYEPLLAVSKHFEQLYPGTSVQWKKRSLKDFGDFPLEKLVPDFDLIMLDHPFTGEALEHKLLLPLNLLLDSLDPGHIPLQREQSLGSTVRSYQHGSTLVALPVDAAALVSANRLNQIPEGERPVTFSDLVQFCKELGSSRVAIPLCQVDVWCLFLTFCAQHASVQEGTGERFFGSEGVDFSTGVQAIEDIYQLLPLIHKDSTGMNPIGLFDSMSGSDSTLLYTPYAFGYTNYSRPNYRPHLLEFHDAPVVTARGESGEQVAAAWTTLMGGVGIGISSETEHPRMAAQFVQLVTTPEIQQTLYASHGGQPAHKSAWLSGETNGLCHNFFSNTLHTLEHAWVRPRVPGFNRFQDQVSETLHSLILGNTSAGTIVNAINSLFVKHVPEQHRMNHPDLN